MYCMIVFGGGDVKWSEWICGNRLNAYRIRVLSTGSWRVDMSDGPQIATNTKDIKKFAQCSIFPSNRINTNTPWYIAFTGVDHVPYKRVTWFTRQQLLWHLSFTWELLLDCKKALTSYQVDTWWLARALFHVSPPENFTCEATGYADLSIMDITVVTPEPTKRKTLEDRTLASYRNPGPKNKKQYEEQQRRNRANIILYSYSLLIHYAVKNKQVRTYPSK